jgi:hypothetical protein
VHEEALETSAVVRELADAVEREVDDLLADGVVATGVVVGGVLFSGDQLLGVEKLAVGARADLVDDGRLQVKEDGARDVLARTSLRDEGVEGIVLDTDRLVRRHGSVRLNSVLKAIQFPARVANLNACLAEVDTNYFAHGCLECFLAECGR